MAILTVDYWSSRAIIRYKLIERDLQMTWVLLVYIYAGVWAKGDSVTMYAVPMASQELCEKNAEKLGSLVSGTAKEVRYICMQNQ